jgi:hypothetical protein
MKSLSSLIWVTAITATAAVTAASSPIKTLLQSNVPIIEVPPTTPPSTGVPGTGTTPTPPDPNPGPPNPTPSPIPPRLNKLGKAEADKLYVYIVRKDKFRDGAPVEESTPGVVGKTWYPITKMKDSFHFKLNPDTAGSEYYVVGLAKVGSKLEYRSKHLVRVVAEP